MNISRWMPGLAALRDYKPARLPHDLAAGLTLGAVMVPVGLAYGELASDVVGECGHFPGRVGIDRCRVGGLRDPAEVPDTPS